MYDKNTHTFWLVADTSRQIRRDSAPVEARNVIARLIERRFSIRREPTAKRKNDKFISNYFRTITHFKRNYKLRLRITISPRSDDNSYCGDINPVRHQSGGNDNYRAGGHAVRIPFIASATLPIRRRRWFTTVRWSCGWTGRDKNTKNLHITVIIILPTVTMMFKIIFYYLRVNV